MAEERLELDVTVTGDFDDLEVLGQQLEDVDREITQAGSGEDTVGIDVDARTTEAMVELEAINQQITRIDDATVDVDTDVSDPDILDADTRVGEEGIVASFHETEVPDANVDDGFRGLFDDAEDFDNPGETRVFSPDAHEQLDGVREVDIDGATVYLDDKLSGVRSGNVPGISGGGHGGGGGGGVSADGDGGGMPRRGERFASFGDLGTNWREQAVAAPPVDYRDATNVRRQGGLFTNLKRDISQLQFTARSFHQAMAAVIPLFGVFVGALPSAIAALGGLATAAIGAVGALGAIGGLGAVGFSLQESGEVSMKPITERLDEIGDTFFDAFEPLAREFAPVFRYALDSLEQMAGPLADASSALTAFTDDFRGAVDFISGSIPSLVGGMLEFADAAMPVLSEFFSALANSDILGVLASHLDQALIPLYAMANGFAQIIPAILKISQGFLIVAGSITYFLGLVSRLINTFPFLAEMIGLASGAFLTLIAYVSISSLVTGGLIGKAYALAATMGGRVVSAVGKAVTAMLGYTATTWQAYFATAALVGVLTLGLGVLLPKIIDHFDILGSNIGDAQSKLEEFEKTKQGMRGDIGTDVGVSGMGGGSNPYVDNSTTVINAGNRDDAARQQYGNSWEKQQHVDSVFGG
jgi:hypothetical protein